VQELPGWGKKSVDKLAATAQQTAHTGVSLTRFLYSLGIPSLGIHAARLVAELYGNWADLAHDLDEASRLDDDDDVMNAFARLREDTEQTKGIGPTLLSHLYEFSRNRRLLDAAKALAANVTIIDDIVVVPRPDRGKTQGDTGIEGPFRDMTVVFAGSVSKQIDRKGAERLARQLGAKSTPTKVTKATGLLVAGARGGKKRKEAESLGVKVMTSEEFLRIVEEHEHILLLANATDDQSVSERNKSATALDETEPMLLPDQTTTATSSNTPFRDRSVVFSGAIAPGVTRQTAQEWARRLGATSTPSQVSKSTGLLVAGSKVAPSKIAKAEALGVPVMDAEAFLRIVADNGLFDGSKDQDGNPRQ
jgi:NAD-dependent DNA ligase